MTTTILLHTLTSTITSTLAPPPDHDHHHQHDAGGLTPSTTSLMSMMMSTTTTATTTTTMGPVAQPSGIRPAPPDYLADTQFVCDQVLIPLVVSFGIVGNLLSLVVLTRKEMASPTNCFLTALAISDISLLLLQLPTFFRYNRRVAASDSYRRFVRYYTVILYVMTNVFLTCTCWLTVAVTVERFLSLRFMMHPRLICSMPRAKRAILAIFFASFLFHFSKFFEYVPNPDLRSPQSLLPTELSLNKAYDTAMHISNITLAALLPIVALIIFNSFLIYFLATHRRRMLKYRSKSCTSGASGSGASGLGLVGGGGGGSGNGNSATSVDMLHVSTVVVAVVLVFVVCHSLGVFLALNIAVHGRHRIFSNHLYLALKHVNGLLVTVNSSVNFLVYCSISRKFRTMFTSIFLRRWLTVSGGGGGGKTGPWCLPLGNNNNSLAAGVVLRAGVNPANGYTRSSNDHGLAAAGPGTREASFVRASPTNSSGTRSLDNTLDL
ncbi:G-protein coupled receptor daf-37-like [Babylonia areolata]|uniref:G-protein coupled receptor daf-37-like n=1 Tax=Babylonia areolata TaxID=304850 RepID=UPI003FD4E49E